MNAVFCKSMECVNGHHDLHVLSKAKKQMRECCVSQDHGNECIRWITQYKQTKMIIAALKRPSASQGVPYKMSNPAIK